MTTKKKTLIPNNQYYVFHDQELTEFDKRSEALDYINEEILPKYNGLEPGSDDIIFIEGKVLDLSFKKSVAAKIR